MQLKILKTDRRSIKFNRIGALLNVIVLHCSSFFFLQDKASEDCWDADQSHVFLQKSNDLVCEMTRARFCRKAQFISATLSWFSVIMQAKLAQNDA